MMLTRKQAMMNMDRRFSGSEADTGEYDMNQFIEPLIGQAYLDQRADETLSRAKERALRRQARAERPGRSWGHRRLLRWTGERLVALGERLQQYGPPPPLSLKDQVGSNQGARA